jgi:hypothetical protein
VKLSPIPDYSSPRRLAAAASIVWLIACAAAVVSWPRLLRTVGDTDDALRLTMVRDLVAGRGWFDQRLSRLQPPTGLYMHWSRLVDGAEAVLLKLFASVLPIDRAEMAMRLIWPVLWILPLTVAVLLIARRLGGGRAVFLGMVTAALSLHASGEFQPGRVDHHNIQITCCLLALAAATQRPAAIWGALCGLATALGLAVGLEALPFAAMIGVAMGLSWAFRRSPGRVLVAYGAALGLGALGLGALQTPPDRWLLPACDALAVNLAAGLGVTGAGLCLAPALGERWGRLGRLGVLAVVGVLAGAVYVAVEPLCLRGPMAGVDPELKAVWLANVREMTPWLTLLARDPPTAINLAAPAVAGLLGWLWLGRRADMRANPAWLATGALLAVSIPMALQASRSIQYSLWLAAPVTAAALVDLADAALAGLMVPAVAVLVAVTQVPGLAAGAAAGRAGHPSAPARVAQAASAGDRCNDTQAFRPLARLAPGLVLSEIDEGPYILADTPDAALQAPYHRMGWGIREARAALGAQPAKAERRIRALKVAYVLNCPAHAAQSDRQGLAADSLQKALDAGRVPAWLERLSRPGEPLQIFRVR